MRLKKIGRDVRRHAAMGYTVIALDEASHIIGWNTWNGWYPVGRPVRTPVSLSRKRFHSFGELHWEVCVPVRTCMLDNGEVGPVKISAYLT